MLIDTRYDHNFRCINDTFKCIANGEESASYGDIM